MADAMFADGKFDIVARSPTDFLYLFKALSWDDVSTKTVKEVLHPYGDFVIVDISLDGVIATFATIQGLDGIFATELALTRGNGCEIHFRLKPQPLDPSYRIMCKIEYFLSVDGTLIKTLDVEYLFLHVMGVDLVLSPFERHDVAEISVDGTHLDDIDVKAPLAPQFGLSPGSYHVRIVLNVHPTDDLRLFEFVREPADEEFDSDGLDSADDSTAYASTEEDQEED
ncbi:unnamed protein product [Symbiodinium sp. CCMP2592]|nr:unnamed protein product [Symbiodinium sp. CCMP2592]